MNKRTAGYCFLFFVLVITVQAGILDRIQKAFTQRDFKKAEKLILKSMEKDSLNPGAKYYYSRLFLDSSFIRYDIDSSSIFIEWALEDFHRADADILDDLQDVSISMDVLISQRNAVAKSAFKRAVSKNALPDLEDFRSRFAYSDLFERATFYRDSLAFEQTKQADSWESYKEYFETYPDAPFVEDARKRYQVLLFKDYTRDNQTSSFIRFLDEHPQTPFRKEAEEIIFERLTLANSSQDYLDFIRRYPQSHLLKKATDILYFMEVDKSQQITQDVYRLHPAIDSLQKLHERNHKVLFPIYENNSFGFMDTKGAVILKEAYEQIDESYLCGAITDNWLQVTSSGVNQLVTRNGVQLLNNVSDYRSIGSQFKVVVNAYGSHLYHASGFKVLDQSVEDAQLLSNGWIAFKQEYSWGICAPNGSVILPAKYNVIRQEGPFVILEEDEELSVSTLERLATSRSTVPFQFDDYELLQDSLLQVFNEDREGVLDQNLEFVVPIDDHEVYINGSFWYLVKGDQYKMIKEEKSKVVNQDFTEIDVNDGWLALKKEEWILLSRKPDGLMPKNNIDSLKLLNDFAAFIKHGDTLSLLFQNSELVPLTPNNKLSVFTKPGSATSYVSIRDGNEYKLIDQNAELLFLGDFDELVLMSDSLFKFKYRGKTGVKRTDGSNLLSSEYDVIDEQGGLLFLLKEGKIGCYDLSNGALIPTEYKARIKRIRGNYEVVKNEKHGLVNPFNKSVISFEYDEMIDWNDTSLWVRKGLDWALINLEEEIIVDKIQSVRPWLIVAEEQLAIVSNKDGYGLYGNVRGEILPIKFNEIINVGSVDSPVFFAEQHLKEADFFVVTYFDANGKSLKSRAFRPEEYDLVYCDK